MNKNLAINRTLLSVDVRQRLGKRPHSPERCHAVPLRETAARREPLTDVHSRLGTTKHESPGLYSEPTKDKKSGRTTVSETLVLMFSVHVILFCPCPTLYGLYVVFCQVVFGADWGRQIKMDKAMASFLAGLGAMWPPHVEADRGMKQTRTESMILRMKMRIHSCRRCGGRWSSRKSSGPTKWRKASWTTFHRCRLRSAETAAMAPTVTLETETRRIKRKREEVEFC